jgi:hypothetical protein
MLLAYVDESYHDDWYILAALLVGGPAAVALSEELDRVALAAARAYGLGADVELHGYEIYHGSKTWKGVPVRARIAVLDDVIEAVASQDARVIARGMDEAGQRARYEHPEPAHSIVLQHLLERIDDCSTSLGEHALVIADEVGVDGEAKHRADLSVYRAVGTTGYRARKLTRIVDTLHFAPSTASRLVQAADVIAFMYRRAFAVQETDERARKVKVRLWNRLRPRVYHQGCWFPQQASDRALGWGGDFRVQTHKEPAVAGSKAAQESHRAFRRIDATRQPGEYASGALEVHGAYVSGSDGPEGQNGRPGEK